MTPRVVSMPTPCPFGGISRRPRCPNKNLTLRGPKWLSRQRLRNRLEELSLSPRHSLFLHVLGYHFPPSSHRRRTVVEWPCFLPQCPLSVAQGSVGDSDANGITIAMALNHLRTSGYSLPDVSHTHDDPEAT